MHIDVLPVTLESLNEYSTVPITFQVESKFTVEQLKDGLGFRLQEEKVKPSYMMDYDVIDGEGPTRWVKRFDTTAWRMFMAKQSGDLVGGAVVAISTPHLFMLDDREDLAVLWDVRVRPDFRHSGIGTKLFNEAVLWSKSKGCHQLKVETQNVNAPACRFYTKQGCHLGGINLYHYTQNPLTIDHIMLLWYLDL
jgi:streptothricin acetyltransferase